MSELTRRIEESLGRWGTNPVLTELGPRGEIVSVGPEDLQFRIRSMTTILRQGGIDRDTVVALFLSNSIDFVVVILALIYLRAVPVFAKKEYRFIELTTIFRDLSPGAVIAESSFVPMLSPFASGRGLLVREGTGRFTVVNPTSSTSKTSGISDQWVSINCTYRGTGTLVGSLALEKQYLHGAKVLQAGLQSTPGESLLYPLPLSHIFTLVGCLFTPLLYGLTGILATTIHPRVILSSFETLGVNHVTAVPEVYRLLLRSVKEGQKFSSLLTFVSGGSRLEIEEYDELSKAFSVEVLHGYGLTEFTPIARNSRGESRAGTVGRVCDGVEVKIANPDDHGRGEILVQSESMFGGYYNRPEETFLAIRDGWFHTGDQGHFDQDHLVFDWETKNTYKMNGVIVDLEEVRSAVLSATVARDARVIIEGNSIVALLETPLAVDIESEEMRVQEVLKHQIAAYKIPRKIRRA